MESKAFAGRSVYSSCYAYSIVLRMIFRFSEKKTGRGFFEKSIPKKDFFAESHVIKAGYVKLTAKEMLGK